MPDGLLDLVFVLTLLAPVGGALGSAVMMWWRAASSPRASSQSADQTAEVNAAGLFPDGAGHRLRLAAGPAHDVRDVQVFLNQEPLSRPQAEPTVGPGQFLAYRYTAGRPVGRDRVLVGVEWDDAAGGGTM